MKFSKVRLVARTQGKDFAKLSDRRQILGRKNFDDLELKAGTIGVVGITLLSIQFVSVAKIDDKGKRTAWSVLRLRRFSLRSFYLWMRFNSSDVMKGQ